MSRDPIHLLRVSEVKDLVEQPKPATPSPSLLQDYEHAPPPRQEAILKFLASLAIDTEKSELIRQNAFSFLSALAGLTQNSVKLLLAEHLQDRISRSAPSRLLIRVAFASCVMPYLKQSHLSDYFTALKDHMFNVGYHWRANGLHGELLRSFKDVGGLVYCPPTPRKSILKWLVLAYIGDSGGLTSYGHVRHVFYSNTAEPIIEELLSEIGSDAVTDFRALNAEPEIKDRLTNQHIARRYETLLDIVSKRADG